ncbi:solute carrier family 35 member B1 homolog [Anthonomus grandis grandis]|uniref:solute carrier family 35 member B1 homolog n=1 Tax=Anthonomus grandis grandis TaxID=2921223 RepID=UPI00216574F2|nr:solute carrier family 35 member B1 homolog [Anthonomus grandis grandis]
MTQSKEKFIIYAAGIFVIYFYYGILQEKVTRGKYLIETVDPEGKKNTETHVFTFALTLVGVQCIINYFIAKGAMLVWKQKEDTTAKLYYVSVSVTYLLAMVASNMALQWVSYPTQVVGKSAKPVPVLILGVLLGKKSYPLRKYLFVFIIVTGVVLFMLTDKPGKATGMDEVGFGVGELLLFMSLIMDGLIGAIQERIRAESKPTGLQMMAQQNGWSSLFLIITVVISGEGANFLAFAKLFPQVYFNLLSLGLASAIGQLFLFSMVSEFGPLPLSIVTTTRKFFTVLGSVILFGNVLTIRQWLGAAMVFTGLFLDAYYAKAPHKKNTAK